MSYRLLVVPVTLVVLALAATTPADAQAEQTLELDFALPAGAATPGGDAVLMPFTVKYACATLFGASAAIAVTPTMDAANGTVSADPASITPKKAPDCTPGSTVTAAGNLSIQIKADAALRAGDQVPVTLNVSSKDIASRDFSKEKTNTVTVGPLLVMTYVPGEPALTGQPGGPVTFQILATSTSNDQVSVATTFPDWNLSDTPPDVLTITLPPPNNTTGSVLPIDIGFTLAEDAEEGTHTFTVQVVAKPAGDPSLTDTDSFLFDLTVEAAKKSGDSEDSPSAALPMTVLLVVALAVALRRRA